MSEVPKFMKNDQIFLLKRIQGDLWDLSHICDAFLSDTKG